MGPEEDKPRLKPSNVIEEVSSDESSEDKKLKTMMTYKPTVRHLVEDLNEQIVSESDGSSSLGSESGTASPLGSVELNTEPKLMKMTTFAASKNRNIPISI